MFVAVGVLTAGGVLPVAAFSATQENAYGMIPSIRCQRQTMPEFTDRFAPVHPLRVEPAPRIVPVDVAHRLSATTRSVEPWVEISPDVLATGLITIVPNMPSLVTVPLVTKLAALAGGVVLEAGRAGDDRRDLVDAGVRDRAGDDRRGARQRDRDIRGAGVGGDESPGLRAHAAGGDLLLAGEHLRTEVHRGHRDVGGRRDADGQEAIGTGWDGERERGGTIAGDRP